MVDGCHFCLPLGVGMFSLVSCLAILAGVEPARKSA